MSNHDQNQEPFEMDGYTLLIAAYRVANSYVTQIKSEYTESTIALGFGPTEEAARRAALFTARKRLFLTKTLELMVGG